MRIFIRRLTGRTIVVFAEADDTVASVQTKVRDAEGVPCGSQQLLFGGRRLDGQRTLGDCGVEQDSTLHMVLRLGCAEVRPLAAYPGSRHLQQPSVRVQALDKEPLAFEPDSCKLRLLSSGSARARADAGAATPADSVLRQRTLSDISDASTTASSRPSSPAARARKVGSGGSAAGGGGEVTLSVKIVPGPTLELSVRRGESIDEVKERIEASEGIPKIQQRLIFAARQLEGQRTVEDYLLHELARPLYLVRDAMSTSAPR